MRKAQTLSAAVGAASVFLLPSAAPEAAHAQILDFQVLEHNDAAVASHGDLYIEDGFQIAEAGPNPLATFGTLEPRYPFSTALFSNSISGVLTLTQVGGGAFDLLSIDIAELDPGFPQFITFTGTLAGGGTVTQSVTPDGPRGLQTFTMIGFTNVTQVQWHQISPFHQFDNINVSTAGSGNSAAPEPATAVLLGTGLLPMLGAMIRRRRLRR